MTDYVITNGRSSAYPLKHYGAQFVGSRATFCLDTDFSGPDANVLAIPNLPITVLSASPVNVGEEFFGLTVQDRINDSLSGITAKTVRSHDMKSGTGQWKYIETSDNVWNWSNIDSWVSAHYSRGRDLVFTLFGTPTWASARPAEVGAYGATYLGASAEPLDMTKWDRFCTQLATRYSGKIKYYEVWNEPNLVGFFSGTQAKLSEMVRRANQAIKAVDPTAKIICPAITSWATLPGQSAETYFTGMMAASDGVTGVMKDWIDIIGVHLYLTVGNSTIELSGVIDRVLAARSAAGISDMEIWDTESSPLFPDSADATDSQMQTFLTRFLITLAAKGIKRTIYYQYDSPVYGFASRPNIITHWQNLRSTLTGNTILSAAKLFDGRLVYTTSAGTSII